MTPEFNRSVGITTYFVIADTESNGQKVIDEMIEENKLQDKIKPKRHTSHDLRKKINMWNSSRKHTRNKYEECQLKNFLFGCSGQLVLHHIVPKAFGGKCNSSNLILLCKSHEILVHNEAKKYLVSIGENFDDNIRRFKETKNQPPDSTKII